MAVLAWSVALISWELSAGCKGDAGSLLSTWVHPGSPTPGMIHSSFLVAAAQGVQVLKDHTVPHRQVRLLCIN